MHRRRLIDIFNFLVDVCFSKVRIIFFPFYIFRQASSALIWVYNFGVNQYVKGKFGFCGRGVRLNGRVFISRPSRMTIGNNVHINDGAYIRAEGGVEVGDNVHISRNLTLYTRNHRYEGDLLPYDSVNNEKGVSIGDNVWIGMNVSVAPGVSIGEGAIIGMGVVLTKNVEPFEVVVPVKPIKIGERDSQRYFELVKKGRFSGASGYVNKYL